MSSPASTQTVIAFKPAFTPQNMAAQLPLPCESEGARQMLGNGYAFTIQSASLILGGDLTQTIRDYFNRQVQYFAEFEQYARDYLNAPVTPRLLCAYIALGNCLTGTDYYTHPDVKAGLELARQSERIGNTLIRRKDLRDIADPELRAVIFLRHLSTEVALDVERMMSAGRLKEINTAQPPLYIPKLSHQSGYNFARRIIWPASALTTHTDAQIVQIRDNIGKIRRAYGLTLS